MNHTVSIYTLSTAAAFFAVVAGALAQAPTHKPQFEVASIKPADPNDRGTRIGFEPGGRFVASGITVNFLIQQAYGVRDFQISGAPGWIGSARFNISAKPDAETAAEIQKGNGNPFDRDSTMSAMLEALLEDRFQLKITHETREMPVYELVVAKGGSKLKESSVPTGDGSGRGGGPQIRMGRGLLTFKAGPMEILAMQLSNQLGRTVIDKTGLKGSYDFELKWTPDFGQQPLGPREVGGPEGAPPVDANGPSIFTALQELGLKLESTKGPVEILVIDHVERPSEN
jgi:bla regulator protein blaR1